MRQQQQQRYRLDFAPVPPLLTMTTTTTTKRRASDRDDADEQRQAVLKPSLGATIANHEPKKNKKHVSFQIAFEPISYVVRVCERSDYRTGTWLSLASCKRFDGSGDDDDDDDDDSDESDSADDDDDDAYDSEVVLQVRHDGYSVFVLGSEFGCATEIMYTTDGTLTDNSWCDVVLWLFQRVNGCGPFVCTGEACGSYKSTGHRLNCDRLADVPPCWDDDGDDDDEPPYQASWLYPRDKMELDLAQVDSMDPPMGVVVMTPAGVYCLLSLSSDSEWDESWAEIWPAATK